MVSSFAFPTHPGEDTSGQRPLGQRVGSIRSLTASQQQAMISYPILSAVTSLCWKVSLNSTQLSGNAGTLIARVLSIGAEALEQVRESIHNVDVQVQILVGNVACAARDMARDLRISALYGRLNGQFNAVLPSTYKATLEQLEALDVNLVTATALAADPSYGNIQTLATELIDVLTFVGPPVRRVRPRRR